MPRERHSENRLVGVYEDGATFRLVVVENGRRRSERHPTLVAANRAAKEFLHGVAKADSMTVREALDAFELHRREFGEIQPQTWRAIRSRLESVFTNQDERVRSMKPERLVGLFRAYEKRPGRGRGHSGPPAVSTRRETRHHCGALWAWLLKEGHALGENPFPGLEVRGVARRGKKQLRFGQAHAWESIALQRAEHDPIARAALIAFVLGMRAGEVVGLDVTDVEEVPDPRPGHPPMRVLYVGEAKTEAGRRSLPVPDFLWQLIQRQAGGRQAGPLFPGRGETRTGRLTVQALRRRVLALCRAAGVPEVTTHGLRGSRATAMREAAATMETIAKALGHASTGVTQRHYVAPGASPFVTH